MWLDWIFPPRCALCRASLKKNKGLCDGCEAQWPALQAPFCSVCARPFYSSETKNHPCGDCLVEPKTCAQVHAAGVYRGVLHDLIVRFKYRGRENFSVYLGGKMSEKFRQGGVVADVLIPVPLHVSRLRERGYNQANLLAREVGRALSLPVDPFILKKTKKSPPQAELLGEERRKNLRDTFEVMAPEKIQGKNILLVDDVYTTGTTIETLAALLLKKGARSVEALVLARAD